MGGRPARVDSFQEPGQDRRAAAGDADGETGETGWYDPLKETWKLCQHPLKKDISVLPGGEIVHN